MEPNQFKVEFIDREMYTVLEPAETFITLAPTFFRSQYKAKVMTRDGDTKAPEERHWDVDILVLKRNICQVRCIYLSEEDVYEVKIIDNSSTLIEVLSFSNRIDARACRKKIADWLLT